MDNFYALWIGIGFSSAVAFWVAWCVVIEFGKLRGEIHAESRGLSQRIYELETRRYPVELDDVVEAYGLVKRRLDDLEEIFMNPARPAISRRQSHQFIDLELGRKIKAAAALWEQGITQKEISKRLGLPHYWVSIMVADMFERQPANGRISRNLTRTRKAVSGF